MRLGSKALAIGIMGVLLTGGASWGQEQHDEHGGRFYSGTRAVLRSAEDDAVLNDGSQYGQSSGPSLFDSPPGTDEDEPSNWDYLVFWPKNERRLVLSSDLIDGDAGTPGNQPLVCKKDSYLFFGRFGEDRDWLEELASVGDSTMGDASFTCWIDNPRSPRTEHRFYDVSWYLQGGLRVQPSGRCVTYSRIRDKTLRFEAPSTAESPATGMPLPQDDGCPAEVLLVTRTEEGGEYTYARESLGYESAPLRLTVEFGGRFL